MRRKVLRDLNAEIYKIDSLQAFRMWALRRVRLDIGSFSESDMPVMTIHASKINVRSRTENVSYIRLSSGKMLTSDIKTALSVRQGKSFSKDSIGQGVDAAWFIAIPTSYSLGEKIALWNERKAKKLSMADKEALQLSNLEYAADVGTLKMLGEKIHALRAQASALSKKCEMTRTNALTVLPKDLL